MRDRVGAAVRFGCRLLPRPVYVVTGGKGCYGSTEADVMAALLTRRGVDSADIILERTARNTFRSAVAVASLLRRESGPVYVATSAYHMPRCVLLLGLAGLDARFSPPAIGPASSRFLRRWFWRLREFAAIPVDAALMLALMLWRRCFGAATIQPAA